jgi:hypothetical protein
MKKADRGPGYVFGVRHVIAVLSGARAFVGYLALQNRTGAETPKTARRTGTRLFVLLTVSCTSS